VRCGLRAISESRRSTIRSVSDIGRDDDSAIESFLATDFGQLLCHVAVLPDRAHPHTRDRAVRDARPLHRVSHGRGHRDDLE
jgi:hypothetical protein